MSDEITFVIIKPNAVKKHVMGEIISIIEKNNFTIESMRFLKLSDEEAKFLYREDKEKSHFRKNISFMTSGDSLAMVVSGYSAVKRMRELIGATSPSERLTGTIRYMYGDDITQNAIHASDSEEKAIEEVAEYFLNWTL